MACWTESVTDSQSAVAVALPAPWVMLTLEIVAQMLYPVASILSGDGGAQE